MLLNSVVFKTSCIVFCVLIKCVLFVFLLHINPLLAAMVLFYLNWIKIDFSPFIRPVSGGGRQQTPSKELVSQAVSVVPRFGHWTIGTQKPLIPSVVMHLAWNNKKEHWCTCQSVWVMPLIVHYKSFNVQLYKATLVLFGIFKELPIYACYPLKLYLLEITLVNMNV